MGQEGRGSGDSVSIGLPPPSPVYDQQEARRTAQGPLPPAPPPTHLSMTSRKHAALPSAPACSSPSRRALGGPTAENSGGHSCASVLRATETTTSA